MLEYKKQQPVLNLAKLQRELDLIVFENIDTSSNWEKALVLLQQLQEQCDDFYGSFIQSKGGEIPKANSYWTLFIDIVARITYFKAFVEQQLNQNVALLPEQYKAAASFLPNSQHESSIEFFEEINASYQSITGESLERHNLSIQDAVENYHRSH